jgi:CCR4-NOT transcriptional complex subunit CAF120
MLAAQATQTPLLTGLNAHKKRQPSEGLINYIDNREREKQFAKATYQGSSQAMQAEIDKRMLHKQQAQMREAQARQQQMQMGMAQGVYHGTPSVMGMSMGAPSVMGMPIGPGTPQGMVGMAYTSPQQIPPQLYQQQGYFQQPMMTPNTNMMPGGWGAPSPQTPQGQYFQQPLTFGHQQPTQQYGASFDREQAAKQAAQQGHTRW